MIKIINDINEETIIKDTEGNIKFNDEEVQFLSPASAEMKEKYNDIKNKLKTIKDVDYKWKGPSKDEFDKYLEGVIEYYSQIEKIINSTEQLAQSISGLMGDLGSGNSTLLKGLER